uniref:Uncharacterized protein n=1 Tax=Panagrellus redivivus TaxID=6233 RepID=A0A7E4ZSD2_PANRE
MSLDDITCCPIPFQRNDNPLRDALLFSNSRPLESSLREEFQIDTTMNFYPHTRKVNNVYVNPYDWESNLNPIEKEGRFVPKVDAKLDKESSVPKVNAKIDEDSDSHVDEGYSSRSPSVKDLADFCDETVQLKTVEEPKCAKKPRHNVVKRKKVGRPPGDNPSAGTLKTRRNRKKFKELDLKALDHGQPFLQQALKRGWRPPADFQLAFKKFTSQGAWKQTAAIRFGGFLPQAKKRGPIRKLQVSLQELRTQEQKKDGMVHKLVQECLTYLRAKLDIPEYNKLVATLPKQMYKTV